MQERGEKQTTLSPSRLTFRPRNDTHEIDHGFLRPDTRGRIEFDERLTDKSPRALPPWIGKTDAEVWRKPRQPPVDTVHAKYEARHLGAPLTAAQDGNSRMKFSAPPHPAGFFVFSQPGDEDGTR